jgi:hypothetical protein
MVLWCLLNQFLWMQLFEVRRSRICPERSSIVNERRWEGDNLQRFSASYYSIRSIYLSRPS